MRQGDNLFNLALKYKTTVNALAKANANIKSLLPGQTVRVPAQAQPYTQLGMQHGKTYAPYAPKPVTALPDTQAGQQARLPQPAPYTGAYTQLGMQYGKTYAPYAPKPVTTTLPDTQRAQAVRAAPNRTLPDTQFAQANMANFYAKQAQKNTRTWVRPYQAGDDIDPLLGTVGIPMTPSGVYVYTPPTAVEPEGYTGYSGYGGGGSGYGGGNGYKPEPYQGFTGAANRNPFGVVSAQDKLYGAGIGLINWRI